MNGPEILSLAHFRYLTKNGRLQGESAVLFVVCRA